MSLASYQLLHSAMYKNSAFLKKAVQRYDYFLNYANILQENRKN